MQKVERVVLIIFCLALVVLAIWAIVGGEDNIARKTLSFIGVVVFSVVGLTVSSVLSYFYEKGGGIPR